MTQTKIKAYVVKYALTKGIEIVEGERCYGDADVLKVPYGFYYHRGEWTTDKNEAILWAKERVKKKIASLKRQIAKLEAMEFQVEDL